MDRRITLSNDYLNWLWFVPIVLLMFWLGARSLNADSIWYDEYWSIYDSGGAPFGPLSPVEVWNGIATRNPQQGPTFYITLNLWSDLVGSTPFAGRAMSLMFGVLATAWTYRLGRDTVSPRVGLYAAAVMATSAFFIHYLHELRGYTMVALVTCVTLWAYWRVITAKKVGRRPQILLLASVTFSLYLHYLTAITFAAIGLYHLVFVRKDWRWWRVVILMGLGGALFLPWIPNLVTGMGVKRRYPWDDPATPLIPSMLQVFGNGLPILVIAAVLLAVLQRGRGARMLCFVTIAAIAITFILNYEFRFHRVRYLLADWPLLALVVALGIAWLARTRLKPVLALGVWMAVGLWATASPDFISPFTGDADFPFNVAAAELRPRVQPGDVVVFNMPEGVKTWLRYEVAHYYLTGVDVRVTLFGVDSWYDQAMQFLQQSPLRLWIAYEQPTRLMNAFEDAMPAPYQRCPAVPTQSSVQLELYARSPVCCVPEANATPRLRFGDGIALTSADPIPAEVSDTLPVLLGWSVADRVPPYTYSAALHVMDSSDNLVAQVDYGLSEKTFSCTESHIALNNAPPGDYTLYVVVYAWESGQRLQGEDVATGARGERFALGTFTIS